MTNELELLLKDMSYNAEFRFLEEAKDKDKLKEIAKKKDIVLPAHDLAIFECVYAFTDRQNKNGCTLPKGEVEASLKTIVGKSIDLDHLRHNVVGHWLDAEIKGDTIYAYGAIFKGSFQEDYEIIKELFDEGNLAVSFEAWGNRIPDNKGGYSLTDIEFAGGALLLKTTPAFDGAGVLELAKNRVLEFAKVMTEPKEYVHFNTNKLEESRYFAYDNTPIFQALSEIECVSCKEKGYADIMMMDYKNNICKTQCINCSAEMKVSLTPAVQLSKKGRKIKMIEEEIDDYPEKSEEFIKSFEGHDDWLSVVLERRLSTTPKLSLSKRIEMKDDEFAIVKNIEDKKIRIFPIHDLAHVEYAAKQMNNDLVNELMEKLSVAKDNVERKIKRRVITIAMDELLKKYNKASIQEVIQEIAKATINRELSAEELEKANTSLNEMMSKKSTSSEVSLQKITSAPLKDAPTSIQTAMTEDEVKEVIEEVTKAPEVPKEDETKPKEDASKEDASKAEELNAKLEESTKKLEEITKALDEANQKLADIEKANTDATLKARKDELADFAKDMSDEDILDEAKYEVAKLKKENAELKEKVEKSSTETPATPDLTKGAADKKPTSAEQTSRNLVNEYAYGRRINPTDEIK